MVVYKYQIGHGLRQLALPGTAVPLSVGIQDGLVLWARVEPDRPVEPWTVLTVFTGEPVAVSAETLQALAFVGTVTNGIGLVYHVFAGRLH